MMNESNNVVPSDVQANVGAARLCFEFWEKRDFAGLISILDDDVELIEVTVNTRYVGRDGIQTMFEKWARAYPDGRIPVINSFGCGEQVSLEWIFRGTNTGEFDDGHAVTSPTGNFIEYQGCSVIRVVNGKIRSIKHYWDQMTIEQQLGTLGPATHHSAEKTC